MQTINLDLSVRSIIPPLHAKQGDVGRKFKAILTDAGVSYSVPPGAAVSVWYSGASGEGNYTDIGADSAVSVSGNEITVELITQMLANYGDGKLCLAINTADGDQIGTWNIPYMVEPLPGMGSAAAQQYFTAFSQAVQNLPYPDVSLSAAGKAADSAAVGAALASKAPAGYGLGEKCVTVSSWDNATKNGFYTCEGWSGYVTAHAGGDISQECFGQMSGKMYKRFRWYCDGSWKEWEWVNPPMTLGEEYRTTERWNGKPVYAKCVDFGALPNVEEKMVYHEIAGVDKIIYASATAWVGNEVMIINSNTYYISDFKAGKNAVAIRTNADMTSWTNCVFTLKYTKN